MTGRLFVQNASLEASLEREFKQAPMY